MLFSTYMVEIIRSPEQKGNEFIQKLSLISSFESSKVITDQSILSRLTDKWHTFVTFPKEITDLIRGSYISPETFLQNLGYEPSDVNKFRHEIVSQRKSDSIEEAVLHYGDQNSKFELRVLNGMTNEHALIMSERASHSFAFDQAEDRAVYQNAMYESLKPIIKNNKNVNYGIRIFDDCIASGDSIFGYLHKLATENSDKLRAGVRIDAAVATPQAIFLLRRLSEIYNFRLEINVTHLGFALTEGKRKNGKLVDFIAYCINPNHYHFILRQLVDGGLSRFMQKFGGGYTQYYNKKNQRSGVLFQGTFKSIHINSNEYLLYLSAYVNLNNKVHQLSNQVAK